MKWRSRARRSTDCGTISVPPRASCPRCARTSSARTIAC
ncbi:MAG: hypothetical protein J0L92_09165 [Deltaproteobacteria bacterium]|nr:hypothetical protein [Deltaproteobacteria bacterium]